MCVSYVCVCERVERERVCVCMRACVRVRARVRARVRMLRVRERVRAYARACMRVRGHAARVRTVLGPAVEVVGEHEARLVVALAERADVRDASRVGAHPAAAAADDDARAPVGLLGGDVDLCVWGEMGRGEGRWWVRRRGGTKSERARERDWWLRGGKLERAAATESAPQPLRRVAMRASRRPQPHRFTRVSSQPTPTGRSRRRQSSPRPPRATRQ